MSQSEVISTRVPQPYARSLRALATLRKTTVSDVVGRIIVEQVLPAEDVDELPVEAA